MQTKDKESQNDNREQRRKWKLRLESLREHQIGERRCDRSVNVGLRLHYTAFICSGSPQIANISGIVYQIVCSKL